MNASDLEDDPLVLLAEEFADRYRRGERPSTSEYEEKYPELAGRIRHLFPALLVMEEFGSVGGPATGPFAEPLADQGKTPQQLGEYRILREVGRGGMGVVYEAVQETLGRHVALKVLPMHGQQSPTHLERFRREARAAAKLHHTNIVPVFGVGEHDSIHYYAMQFISGQGLDKVLGELQRMRSKMGQTSSLPGEAAGATPERGSALSANIAQGLVQGRFPVQEAEPTVGHEEEPAPPAEAAALSTSGGSGATGVVAHKPASRLYFRSVAQVGVQVAHGLAHAHQQGILHRDIKPSNLLLDTQGTVWITDFGLAKAEDSGEFTATGDIVGTVRYMAPERFQGQADPRSDIYSLGLTLYEMLTLRPAFAASQRAQLIDRVLHEAPSSPRSVDAHIPRDLEIIVQKASAKSPEERYATAQELADDLQRFLNDEPIRAKRPTLVQRAKKWARRHRPVVWSAGVATAALLVMLVVGLVVNNVLVSREAEEKTKALADAKASAEDAQTKTTLTINALAEARRSEQGATNHAKRAEQAAKESEKSLTDAIAAVDQMLERVGGERLAHVPFMEQVRRELLEDALKFYLRFLERHGSDRRLRTLTGRAHQNVGSAHAILGEHQKAEAAYQRAITLLTELVKERPHDPEPRFDLLYTHTKLGLSLQALGRLREAERAHGEAIDLAEKLVEDFPRRKYKMALAGALNNLTSVYKEEVRPDAERILLRSAEIWHELEKDDPQSLECLDGLGMLHNNLGILLRGQGRYAEAEEALKESVRYHGIVAEKNAMPAARLWLAGSYLSLGLLFKNEGKQKKAEEALEQATELLRPLARDYPTVSAFKAHLAANHFNRGLLFELSRPDDAEKEMREALRLEKELFDRHPDVPEYRESLARSYNSLGRLLTRVGKHAEAEKSLGQAQKHLEPLVDKYPGVPHYRKSLAVNCGNLGVLLGEALLRTAEADAFVFKCLEHFQQLEKDFPAVPDYQSGLAGALHNAAFVYRKRDQLADARRHMEKAVQLQQAALAAVDGRNARYRKLLGDHYWGLSEIHLKSHDHAAAATAAENLPRICPDSWEAYDNAVGLLACCAQLAKKDDKLPMAERQKLYKAYKGRVRELLGEATKRIAAAKPQTEAARLDLARGSLKIGNACSIMGDGELARKCYEKAVDLHPTLPDMHVKLGAVLRHQRQLPQAADALGKAIALRPDYAEAHEMLAMVLEEQGKFEDAVAAYRTAGKHHTDKAQAARIHVNVGALLAKRGRLSEAERDFRRAVELQPKQADAHYSLGLSLGQQGKTAEAIQSFRTAIAIKADYSEAWGCLGFALQKHGEFAPGLTALEKSRDLLPEGDAGRPRIQGYIDHCAKLNALDRQLPEILKGTVKPPQSAGERINLAQVCVAKKLYGAAARFYKEAFAADPRLAEEWPAGRRYDAARAAALAGCVQGQDMPPLDDEARAGWRRQALDWLRADLALGARRLETTPRPAHAAVGQKLAPWLRDPDLAGLRGPAILDLPEAERQAWRQLWAEVDDLLRKVQENTTAVPPAPLVVGKVVNGTLTRDDPIDSFPMTKNSHHQVHSVALEAGLPYLIDLRGDFDTFLRIENPEKKILVFNDDVRPDDLNSRLVFIPPQKDTYRLVVTSYKPGETGTYTLSVQKAIKVGEPILIKDKLQETDMKGKQGKCIKLHKVKLVGGSPYTIELESADFDTFLVLLDGEGKESLADNDDIFPGNTRLSRLDFTPKADAIFTIAATSFRLGETGAYTLTVQRYEAVKDNKTR